jgi:hypothetical protein
VAVAAVDDAACRRDRVAPAARSASRSQSLPSEAAAPTLRVLRIGDLCGLVRVSSARSGEKATVTRAIGDAIAAHRPDHRGVAEPTAEPVRRPGCLELVLPPCPRASGCGTGRAYSRVTRWASAIGR